MSKHARTFLAGAGVLTVSTLFARLVGVAQRVPLYRLLGGEGTGLVQYPQPIFGLMLALAATGLNIAVSRLISKHLAHANPAAARRVFRVSLWLMAGLGLGLAVVLAVSAGWLSTVAHRDPRAALSYLALAPAVFVGALVAAHRGLFQGAQDMTPNAISQIVEQIARVAAMVILAYVLLPYGLAWAAFGASLGALAGSICSYVYLLWQERRAGGDVAAILRPAAAVADGASEAGESGSSAPALDGTASETAWDVARAIMREALPVIGASLLLPLLSLVDATVIPSRLATLGLGATDVTTVWGQLSGPASALIGLPTVLTSALFVSLVPAITLQHEQGRLAEMQQLSALALRLTLIVCLPSLAGLMLLAPQVTIFIFGDAAAGTVVRALAPSLVFLGLQQATAGVLQGMGSARLVLINSIWGLGVKLVLTYVLTGMPTLGINGAALATGAAYLTAAGLNVSAVSRRLGRTGSWLDLLLRPGLATLVMTAAAWAVYEVTVRGLAGRLGGGLLNALATLLAIGLAGIVYAVALLRLRGIRAADLELLPRVGPTLVRTLGRWGMLPNDAAEGGHHG